MFQEIFSILEINSTTNLRHLFLTLVHLIKYYADYLLLHRAVKWLETDLTI